MAVVTRGSRYCSPAVTGGRPAGFQAAARGLLGFAPPPRSATCRADGSFAKHGGASLVLPGGAAGLTWWHRGLPESPAVLAPSFSNIAQVTAKRVQIQ